MNSRQIKSIESDNESTDTFDCWTRQMQFRLWCILKMAARDRQANVFSNEAMWVRRDATHFSYTNERTSCAEPLKCNSMHENWTKRTVRCAIQLDRPLSHRMSGNGVCTLRQPHTVVSLIECFCCVWVVFLNSIWFAVQNNSRVKCAEIGFSNSWNKRMPIFISRHF